MEPSAVFKLKDPCSRGRRRSSLVHRRRKSSLMILEQGVDDTLVIDQVPAHWFNLNIHSAQAVQLMCFRKAFGVFGKIKNMAIELVSVGSRKASRRSSSRRRTIKPKPSAPQDDTLSEETRSILQFTANHIVQVDSSHHSNINDMWVKLTVQFIVSENVEKIAQDISNHVLVKGEKKHSLTVRMDTSGTFKTNAIRQRATSAVAAAYEEQFRLDSAAEQERLRKKKDDQILRNTVGDLENAVDQLTLLKKAVLETKTIQTDRAMIQRISNAQMRIETFLQEDQEKKNLAMTVLESQEIYRKSQRVITKVNKELRSVHMYIPTPYEILNDLGAMLFLKLCQQLKAESLLSGSTVLVPEDGAFLGSLSNFEDQCWNVHVLDGSYRIADLANMKSGYIRTRDNTVLRAKLNIKGKYECWIHGDSHPPSKAKVVKADIICQNGTVIHLVNRVLYPDSGYGYTQLSSK